MNALKRAFFLAILVIILNFSPAFGADAACSYFYKKLTELPHVKLTVNDDGFQSMWDGKEMSGCELIFESHASIVSGEKVYRIFQSFIQTPGWKIDNNLLADGPGSSSVGIENDKHKCCINWSQHAWIDEKSGKLTQSNHIEMIIQCSPK